MNPHPSNGFEQLPHFGGESGSMPLEAGGIFSRPPVVKSSSIHKVDPSEHPYTEILRHLIM